MIVLPNMGLVKWDSINDTFSHEQLASNFQVLDEHDHTPGKGKQIPYGGLAEQSVGPENLRQGIDTAASAYRTIRSGTGSYIFGESGVLYFASEKELKKSGTGYVLFEIIYLAPADYAAVGFTPKLRLRSQCSVGESIPTVNYTTGLYPLSIASGTYTTGTVVSGSTATFSSFTANTITSKTTADFTIPSEGSYVVGVSCSGTANAAVGFNYQLQVHHV